MLLFALLFLPPAWAQNSLSCKVISREGLYAGGTLTISEEKALTVTWQSPAGNEEQLLGGTKVCGLETRALRYPVRCTSAFTNPTPLQKLSVICRTVAPDRTASWVGSLQLVLSPGNGQAQLRCRTSLGAYTDFQLDLNACAEDSARLIAAPTPAMLN